MECRGHFYESFSTLCASALQSRCLPIDIIMTAGASVDDYYLASQSTSGVKPPSRLEVMSKSAALSDNRLHAVFELSLAYTASDLDSVGVIYAAGPLDSTGALQQHTYVTHFLKSSCSLSRCVLVQVVLIVPAKPAGKYYYHWLLLPSTATEIYSAKVFR